MGRRRWFVVALSVLFRVPPSQVERWPNRDVEELDQFFRLYGMPDPNMHAAQLCAMLHNANLVKGKAKDQFDFLPDAYRGKGGPDAERDARRTMGAFVAFAGE